MLLLQDSILKGPLLLNQIQYLLDRLLRVSLVLLTHLLQLAKTFPQIFQLSPQNIIFPYEIMLLSLTHLQRPLIVVLVELRLLLVVERLVRTVRYNPSLNPDTLKIGNNQIP